MLEPRSHFEKQELQFAAPRNSIGGEASRRILVDVYTPLLTGFPPAVQLHIAIENVHLGLVRPTRRRREARNSATVRLPLDVSWSRSETWVARRQTGSGTTGVSGDHRRDVARRRSLPYSKSGRFSILSNER